MSSTPCSVGRSAAIHRTLLPCDRRRPHSPTRAADAGCLDPSLRSAVERIHGAATQAVFCITGGASQAIGWLLSVPGASSTVLEVSVPYSRQALVEYLGGVEPSRFCSREAARAIARAAYRRAVRLSPPGADVAGVGASCALASEPPRKGGDRVHVAAHTASGVIEYWIQLAKGERSRWGEDDLSSRVLLRALADSCGQGAPPGGGSPAVHVPIPLRPRGPEGHGLESLNHGLESVGQGGYGLPGSWRLEVSGDSGTGVAAAGNTDGSGEGEPATGGGGRPSGEDEPLEDEVLYAAHRRFGDPLASLLKRQVRLVEIWVDAAGASHSSVDEARGKLVLPGSFNPLHEGHRQLLAAASRKRPAKQAAYELAVTNADKGELPVEEVRRRLAQFASPLGPPVIVTCAPLYLAKARLLPGSTFVVGADTAVRLVMPKYYHDSEAEMVSALLTIARHGCDFLVAGRLGPDGRFVTLHDVRIPPSLESIFESLEDFRVDISSTELRGGAPERP